MKIEVTDEEAWMLYDLVTAKAEALDRVELEAMQGFGGAPWYALKKKLRAVVGGGEA